MRIFDTFLRRLLWLCFFAGVSILAYVLDAGKTPGSFINPAQWLTSMAFFGSLWLSSVLGIWAWDGKQPGPQNPLFYVCSIVAIATAARIAIFVIVTLTSVG